MKRLPSNNSRAVGEASTSSHTTKPTRRVGNSIARLGGRSDERRLYVSYSKGYNHVDNLEKSYWYKLAASNSFRTRIQTQYLCIEDMNSTYRSIKQGKRFQTTYRSHLKVRSTMVGLRTKLFYLCLCQHGTSSPLPRLFSRTHGTSCHESQQMR